ncbi:MAG: hypothetical protein ACOX2O_03045 [Bdellovibrionota bacterium]|jgi:hypothetical protein
MGTGIAQDPVKTGVPRTAAQTAGAGAAVKGNNVTAGKKGDIYEGVTLPSKKATEPTVSDDDNFFSKSL